MKLLLLATILLPSILIAQIPQPMPMRPVVQRGTPVPTDALPENYQVTLTITDKDGQPVEVSVVVASTRFTALLGEQHLTFEGTVLVEDSGIVIAYALGWETLSPVAEGIQSRSSSMQGSVRLQLGEEVQIIRAGTRVARLSIKKLEPAKPK